MPVRTIKRVLVNLLLMIVTIACTVNGISAIAAEKAVPACNSIAEAAELLRQGMERRDSQIHLIYETRADVDDSVCQRIYDAALCHTGIPTEGDYLAMTISTWRIVYNHTLYSNGVHTIDITYHLTYYTTAEQEAEMSTLVAALLEELNLWDASEWEKITGIYDWMCQNITYDETVPQDKADKLKHTAYAALKKRTAVCQGYATLFYRLALELGVDARVITGTGDEVRHAWNIARLDGAYYNLDATWDAVWFQAGLLYDYFLRTEEEFKDHERDPKYKTDCFLRNYPVYNTASVPLQNHTYLTLAASATCTQDGLEEYICVYCGHCYAVPSAALGHNYREAITPPSCTEAGYSAFTCNDCMDHYEDKKTSELGHSYGPWQTVTEATTRREGLQMRICAACGNQEQEVITRLQPEENKLYNMLIKQSIVFGFVVAGCLLLLWGARIIERRRKNRDSNRWEH